LAVVAHDAGAANHLLAWLKDAPGLPLSALMQGPAQKLWQQQYGNLGDKSLPALLANAGTLISGTGWASTLEHEARKLARQLGLYSIAVIDHWTNYPERFVRDGCQELPDEIWVSDSYAKALAEAAFPRLLVVQQSNNYLGALVQEVRALERSQENSAQQQQNPRLLFVLEPIRQAWGAQINQGEFIALENFYKQLKRLPQPKKLDIKLRPHPSDAAGKYQAWIAQHSDLAISLDDSATLAHALAWATVVIGCQSYAMVLALAAGRQVFCAIPEWAPASSLPFKAIRSLSFMGKDK
jgi:hypothetical protein